MRALLVAGSVSLIFSLVITPLFVRWFYSRGISQHIREDGPHAHMSKAGTPTMGGICIVAGGVAGYVAAHLVGIFFGGTVFTDRGILCVSVIICAGIVGALDDYLKVRHRRNLGLNKRAKIAGQLFVAIAFVLGARTLGKVVPAVGLIGHQATSTQYLWRLSLPLVVWVLVAMFVIIGTANAVNLTDGLDGLAAGSAVFAFAAFAIVAFWQWRHGPDFSSSAAFDAPYSLDLAVFAVSMLTACAGFLWWNAAPARIFMGDTGSLAIGAGLAALAICLDATLLLIIVGGLYVIETISVIAQIVSFRMFHKRVFRMAPLHHHFELAGWPETTVIVRFWIIAGLFMTLALGVYYAAYQLSVSGGH